MLTPYDRVRLAWESPDRAGELNRVVEAMAAEGLTRDELEEALTRLLLEARDAGADDETEEVINGVGDRLSGWCHRDWRIVTRDQIPAAAIPPRSQAG